MIQIIQKKSNREIDVKRFYLPGVTVEADCACGNKIIWDGDTQYLSYPIPNKPITWYLYCSECDTTQEVKVMLTVDLQLVE